MHLNNSSIHLLKPNSKREKIPLQGDPWSLRVKEKVVEAGQSKESGCRLIIEESSLIYTPTEQLTFHMHSHAAAGRDSSKLKASGLGPFVEEHTLFRQQAWGKKNLSNNHSQMASRGCLRSADAFCYVCGHFIKTRARKYSVKACRKMCEAYKAYFGMPVGDQDKSWAPHVTCEYCKKTLEGWYRGEKRAMKFAIPRIWREPTDHSNNCYFCMVEPTKRRTGKNAPQIVYPDLPSSIAPVPHCPQLPVPTPPTRDRSSSGDNSKSDSEEDTGDLECDFTDADDEKRPYFPNQKDINDLIRDLGLTKSNAELLTSRLKQWNLLDESVQVTEQRSRHQTVSIFFKATTEEGSHRIRSFNEDKRHKYKLFTDQGHCVDFCAQDDM
ncbi:uncharacterized protein ACMZJ9_001951 [Mantella aurantiaca]